jgi:pimeloyl-ACP methyl ester carboxylesterase
MSQTADHRALPSPQRLVIAGIETACLTGGEGPVLLMLHGWGASAALVWPLASLLAARGLRVIVPDLPGFGETAPPSEAWGVTDYAKFMVALADHFGLDRFHLFGHSFGGRIGLVMGAHYPGRIKSLVLVDAAGVRPALPAPVRLRQSVYRSTRSLLRSLALNTLADHLIEWYAKRYGSPDYQQTSGSMRETFVRVVNEDLLATASEIPVPVLLIWGELDTDTPLAQGKRLEAAIPDAGLVVLEGAGHYSYLEQPQRTALILAAFILDQG